VSSTGPLSGGPDLPGGGPDEARFSAVAPLSKLAVRPPARPLRAPEDAVIDPVISPAVSALHACSRLSGSARTSKTTARERDQRPLSNMCNRDSLDALTSVFMTKTRPLRRFQGNLKD
jgi:hypothetical protein